MIWYRPTFCGDIRLSADPDDEHKSVLIVVDPTPFDMKLLEELFTTAREKGWCGPAVGVAPIGETRIVLSERVEFVGCVLFGAQPGKRPCLSVAVKGDKIVTTFGSGEPRPDPASLVPVEAIATVDRPVAGTQSRDCPESLASEVLRRMVPPAAWACWEKNAYLVVEGNLTGHRYRVAHRRHATARGQGAVAFDLDDQVPLNAGNWTLPPPEEALSFALILAHREHWLRCPPIFHQFRYLPKSGIEQFSDPFPETTVRDLAAMEQVERIERAVLFA